MIGRIRRAIQPAHLFVLPHVIFLVVFAVGPALYALVISFASFKADALGRIAGAPEED